MARGMASSGTSGTGDAANVAVIKDMMAVGPNVTSFDVPKNVYTKHPMKAE